MEKIATIQSKLNIEYMAGKQMIEHHKQSKSYEDDDTLIYLSFN